jgi:hypothetical protein
MWVDPSGRTPLSAAEIDTIGNRVLISQKHRANLEFSKFRLYYAMTECYGSISIPSRRMSVSILNLCNTNTKHFKIGPTNLLSRHM